MKPRDSRELLWEHLRELPAFRSLIRVIEGRLLLEAGPLPAPLLDIGCGDGHFAGAFFPGVAVGIDLDLPKLREAARRRAYRHLGAASAARLPFRDASFPAVLANCALEHIPALQETLDEIARVLRPGGTFVFTVPSDRHNRNLAVARLLEVFRLPRLAGAYREWFRTMQVHIHMYPAGEWTARVEAAGLRVTASREYLSPRTTAALEMGHYLGWHNVVSRKLFGRWVLFPWRPLFGPTERALARLVEEDGGPGASCIFFVATRPPA